MTRTTLLLITLFATAANAQTIREVTASDSTLVTLNTQIRYTTLIVLPDGEDIIDVSGGDKGNWVISEPRHNIAYVKPTTEKAQTNLNLIGVSGTIYSFLLKEVSGSGTQADVRVNVLPDPNRTTQSKQKYYTAESYEAIQREAAAARESSELTRTRAEAAIDQATTKAPETMRFPYEVVLNTEPFLIRMMWTDGRFTYIRTDAQELPTLYELKDDKPSLITFTARNGLYTVPKILGTGYFQLGKSKLNFTARTK